MSRLDHPYFGMLDTADGFPEWERAFSLNGRTFDGLFFTEPGVALDKAALDGLATMLEDLPATDGEARDHLRTYLEEDRHYIDWHVEELSDTPIIGALATGAGGGAVPVDAFVAAMALNGLHISVQPTETYLVLDYMIDPGNSDQMLAVKLAPDRSLLRINWES